MSTDSPNAPMEIADADFFGPLEVVVADDLPLVRRLLREMLRYLGVTGSISEAADGLEAWELIQQAPPGLVICDVNMPRMTGLQLLRTLRDSSRHRHIPFLLITGEISEGLVSTALLSNLDAYLMKPFRLAALEKRLRALLLPIHLRRLHLQNPPLSPDQEPRPSAPAPPACSLALKYL